MTDPAPSGESERLEERLLTDSKYLRQSLDRAIRTTVATDVLAAREEIARLRAEVVRLQHEVVARNQRALDGDLAVRSMIAMAARAEAADAEVVRLAAGWEAEVHRAGELRTALDEAGVAVQRVNGRLVALPTRTTARLIAAEAEAARYREALEAAEHDLSWMVPAVEGHRNQQRAMRTLNRVRRVLTTEGGDR